MEPRRNPQQETEHIGCWVVFCALMVAMIMQAGRGAAYAQFAGEWCIFIVLSVIMMIGYIRSGIWRAHDKVHTKARLAISLICGLAVVAFVFGMIWRNVEADKEMLGFAFLFALIGGIIATALCFIILTVASRSAKDEETAEQPKEPIEAQAETKEQA